MPRQYRKDALIIFCLLAFFYAYFYQDGGTNGNSRFSLIFAIVHERRLSIDNFYNRAGTRTGDVSFFNDHYYSDKAIGTTVIGAVFYLPFYWMKLIFNHPSQDPVKMALTFLVIGLPSAIAGSFMYIMCLYMSNSRLQAFLVTMTITLGTMYLPYTGIFFSHQFSSSLLFIAFFMIFLLKERPEIPKNWYLFLIGLALGWALISEYPTAVIILALVIYYFSIVWRNYSNRYIRFIVLPFIGGAIPVLLVLLYNKMCFGNFLAIGYVYHIDPYFRSEMAKGVMGIHWPNLRVLFYTTLHPTMGIFWESPALVLSIIGAVVILSKRRYRAEGILALWVIGSYLVMMSGYYMWWGGGHVGPRHIIPILPFFCVLLIFIPKRLTWPFVVLSLVSIGQMLIVAASTVGVPESIALSIRTRGFFEFSNIYSFCLKQLVKGVFAHSWGNEILNLHSWGNFIPLVVGLTGVTIYFCWNKGDRIK